MARPEHEYSEVIAGKIHALVTFGIPKEKIACYLPLAVKTINKHYEEVLNQARGDRNTAVEAGLFYNATVKNNVVAQMFYLKTQMPEKYGEKYKSEDLDKTQLLVDIQKILKAQ